MRVSIRLSVAIIYESSFSRFMNWDRGDVFRSRLTGRVTENYWAKATRERQRL